MSQAFKAILAQVVPVFRTWEFKGSGQNFRKSTDQAVCVINFQKSSGGHVFYVNLGVQPLFVPGEGNSHPDPKTMKEYDCIFRKRVEPPQGTVGWPYSVDCSLLELLRTRLTEAYEDFLTPLLTIPGPITEATVSDFDSQAVHPLFGGRHSRNFLHFSRIALATGDRAKADAFARAGLSACPERATALLAELQTALANAES